MEKLRVAILLSWLLLAAVCAQAVADDFEFPEDQPQTGEAATQPADEAASAQAQEPQHIPLDTTLRFIIQPTILGLVPPRDPAGFGEVFVRITETGRNSITVHYEIKEEVPVPPGEEPDHRPGSDRETRIRRGEITAAGIRGSEAILPPLYWGDGALQTDSALLWLSGESYRLLADSASCPLDLRFTGPVDSPAAAELAAAIDQLAGEADAQDAPAFALEDAEPVQYPCVVNGKRARLSALHARDSLGLAEYWVLDDRDNPLVLKLTYTLGDGEDEELSFIEKGGGYAITSIDFSPGWRPGR